MIAVSVLRAMAAAGATQEMIFAAIEADQALQAEVDAAKREANRIRKQNQRARHADKRDIEGQRGTSVTTPSSLSPPSMVSPITPSLTTPSSPSPTTGKRATRLPDDWTPSEKDLEYAAKLGVGGVTLAYEINKFRNHWTSKSGKDAAKLRWDRTWQNWIIGAKERSNGKTRFNQPAGGVGDAAAALARHASDGGVTIPARPRLGG